jgi:membrane protein YdbS with pleckstrin-like domain
MTEQESANLADGYRRLNRKSMVSMYIGNAIGYVVLLAVLLPVILYSQDVLGPAYGAVLAASFAILALALAYAVIEPRVYYARYRYMIAEDRVDVRYGVLLLRHIVVPIERVHQVEVSRGPVNNLLGLANVTVTTAGGTAAIRYLEVGEAERIADILNRLVGAMIRGRERT